jgi:pSer/pThr/pTyr-binding forkhead associated (FHA) protein
MEFMSKIQVLEGPMSGTEFELVKEVIFVGRSPANDFQILDEGVSRKHLKIFSVESCYFVEDLKTKNGTMINGGPLDAGFARLITEDDRIQLGASVIRLNGIGANRPPITVEEIKPHPSEKVDEPKRSSAYSGEERRSRAFSEMNFVYDLMESVGEGSNANQLLERVTEFLFKSYPRIDRVSAFLFDDEEKRMEEIVSQSKQNSDRDRSFYTKAILDRMMQDGTISTVYLKADKAREGFTSAQDTVAMVAVICIPLVRSAQIRGALNIEGFGESNPVREEDFLVMKIVKCLLELSLQIADLSKSDPKHSRNRKRA